MATVIGQAFLSATLQVALENLASPILREFGARIGIDKDLKKLTRTLAKIQAVLNDAEARQINDMAVKLWLSDLKEAAYDADDVLDEVATEAFRFNQEKKASSLISLSKDFLFKLGLAPKIKEINERLDEIAKERDELGLREGAGATWIETRDRERLQTSSLIDESCVFGRKEDKKEIVNLLVSDDYCGNDVGVLPIVGMGGLGKTTLAQLVFNDETVARHFDLKMWVCVSDDFNAQRLTKSILESVERKSCDLMDLNILQTSLQDRLRGKRFLLVLDDVWHEKKSDWDVVRLPFRAGASGSKIIVTTRSEKVASITGTFPPFRLEGLSENDCWLLFKQRAFIDGNEDAHQNLVPIGKEILKKCGGLPLAAKTLGGLLHSTTEVYEWEMILKSDLWDLEVEENEILPALRLSYNHLPAHLKQCFIYCSIFPKDHNFDEEKLVLLWMAEGFVISKGRRCLEDVASGYFHDLLLRSFFQRSKTNPSKFVMHDLIHDLAQFVAGESCFTLDVKKLQDIGEKVRHSSVLVNKSESVPFEAFRTSKSLRTMLLLCREPRAKVPHDLILSLRCLRSLDLCYSAIKELPDLMGNLRHIRFLDLSHTSIRVLPESICSLYNLQTLVLINCKNLHALPGDTNHLVNLRHLNLTGCGQLISMPPDIGKLTSLQRLHRIVAGKGIGCGIGELKNMNELRATLCIDTVGDVPNITEAKEANLKKKQYINELVLRWGRCRPDGIDDELLECLEPHTNLRELRIDVYPGAKFPNWMGCSSLSHLEKIEFFHCNYCKTLPPLGQLPSLKSLSIYMMCEVENIGREFYGEGKIKGFPSLEKLKLEDMRNLKEWQEIDHGEFPKLQELAVLNCPNISSLPKFPALCELLLDDCNETIWSSVPLLTSLSSLKISNFRRTEVFPEGLFQALSSLKELRIKHFYRLRTLQEELGLHDLPSLQRLEILFCPKLRSFSGKGFPLALQYLSIRACNDLKDLPNGLQSLSSLQDLSILNCPRLVSFPEEKLPSSLKSLRISACANLESLPSGLHDLLNLESLGIQSCPKIASLPTLGLPASLSSLSIFDCELLDERCRQGGEDWPKIAHVAQKWIGNY